MNMTFTRKVFFISIITFGVFLSASGITNAQTVSVTSNAGATIAFPVAELGNCADAGACKTYCDNTAHIGECVSFAEKNGLMSAEDVERAREFADVLRGEGPGSCKTKDECEAYCADISRADECISFAEKHNLIPKEQLAEAKKIAQALKDGAKLPGGCKDKNSCEQYCTDAAHGDECLTFAEKAGFVSPEEAEQARKVLPLMQRGETPGKCKTKAECENYCKDEAHTMDCVSFAEKAGFMSKEEAEMVRKTGGKGPGGCRSKEACDAYCNAPENQNACFAFAEEHGLIPADKLKEIKDGMGRLRSGLSQMPGEAVNCLKDKLGNDVIGRIESGQFTPSKETGELIKGCVEQAMPQIKERIGSALKMATPAVTQCLESNLGAEGLQNIKNGGAPTPEMGDAMKKCFESMKQEGIAKFREGLGQMPPEMKQCVTEKLGADTIGKIESGADVELGPESQEIIQGCVESMKGAMMQKMEEGLKQAPPEIRDCIQGKLGDIEEKISSGAVKQSDIQTYIQECAQNFKPAGVPQGMEQYAPKGAPTPGYRPANVPEEGGGGAPGVMPPSGGAPDAGTCAKFSMAPSCDYVPAEARELCKQCKER
jgi:hypothetical protein